MSVILWENGKFDDTPDDKLNVVLSAALCSQQC